MIDADKLATYIKRHEILAKEIKDHYDLVLLSPSAVSVQDCLDHMTIMDEVIENMSNVNKVYYDAVNKYQHGMSIVQTALRFYAKTFGDELITEKDIDFGEQFQIKATVLPIDDDPEHVKIIVDWKKEDK